MLIFKDKICEFYKINPPTSLILTLLSSLMQHF